MGGRGFLGTNAPLAADISLVLSLGVALLLTVGAGLALRRRYTAHRWVQTGAVVLNAAIVLAVMLGSFFKSAALGIPQRLGEPYYVVAAVHGLAGLFAFLFGAFVALRGNGFVPRALQFRNYKLFMRTAYAAYMAVTALGVLVYATWYLNPPEAAAPQPAAQAANEALVPMTNFVFNPRELVIPAGTTVVWINQDGAPHTATADDRRFASDSLARGQRFSHTFSEVGVFPYFCELHGAAGGVDMAGVIRVVAAGQAPLPAAAAVAAATAAPLPTVPLQTAADSPRAAAFIRQLLENGPGLPTAQGYAVGLRGQADELERHARFLADARATGDLDGVRRHAEHVSNLLAGSLDPRFGDLNGDGRAQNPGDGFGLLPNGAQAGYLAAVLAAADGAAGAGDATDAIRLHAGHVRIAATNMQGWAEEARDLALRLARANAAGAATDDTNRLLLLSAWIARGRDQNGDGEIAPTRGEGGGLVAYQHAQYMAGLAAH
jgi:plastocyanin